MAQWRAESAANPLWPLPPEYAGFSPARRREERIKLVTDHSTPLHFMRAWDAFCNYYLRPVNANFYFQYKKPGPMHYAAVYDLARHPYNAIAWPRGAGKSVTLVRSMPLFLAYTRPHMEVTLVASTLPRAKKVINAIRKQIVTNKYLEADFGVVRVKGRKWTETEFSVANNFSMSGAAIGGMNLGDRPQLLFLDDVEHDPAVPESGPKLTEQLEHKLFDTFLPMMQEGTSLFWVGTIRPRRSTMLGRILRSKDPRFEDWNRRCVSIYDPVRGEAFPCWPEKWPVRAIQKLKRTHGPAFYSEYMNVNRSDRPMSFKFDAKFHTYAISREDGAWTNNPLESRAVLSYLTRETDSTGSNKVVHMTAREVLPQWTRFLTIDYARVVDRKNDFHCIHALALAHNRKLVCLDMWHAKTPRQNVIEAAIRMALKWQVRFIGSESFSVEQEVTDILTRELEEPCLATMGYVPFVFPLGAKGTMKGKKGDRIDTLTWRFDRDAILLPAGKSFDPPWRHLFDQIINYNGNPDDLANDDALDALGMSSECLKRYRGPSLETIEIRSDLSKALDDTVRQSLGMRPMDLVNPHDMSAAELLDTRRYFHENSRARAGSRLPRTQYADDPSIADIETEALAGLKQLGGVWVFDPTARPTPEHDQ